LITAAAAGKLKAVQILSKSVSTLNIIHPELGTALQAATAKGYIDVVREILAHKADPNIRGNEWNSQPPAIMLAVRTGDESLVQCLLDAGMIPTPGYIPAVQVDNISIVKKLLSKGKPKKDYIDWEGTALNTAIAHGRNDIDLLLLDGGADPNFQGDLNATIPIQTAMKTNNLEGLRLPGKRGADLNQTTVQENALITAVQCDDEKAVELLLDLGANINQPGFGYAGSVPNVAISKKNINMTRLLLSRDADPNMQGDINASTPLQTAVQTNDLEGAALFVQAGADCNFASYACPSVGNGVEGQ
jgi:ankyrin repeat protein